MPESKYKVSPRGSASGVVIHGAEPTMQAAYRRFVMDELGMSDYIPMSIPQGLGRLVSPLSMSLASDILSSIAAMVKSGGITRVVCIVRREEIESTILKHLIPVPKGGDLAACAMAIGKAAVKRQTGIDVEMYLATVEGEDISFFRLDS